MTNLTKDQVRKLTPEQQEAIGGMEAQHIRSRQHLLERACRGMTAVAALLTGLTYGMALLSIAFPRILPIAIVAVVSLVTYHASRLHLRLDALIELFDSDIKRTTERGRSDDDRPG